MEAFPFSGPAHGIRTRKGAELRKREAFSSAAREERSDEAGRGRRQPRADIPHRPPLIWKRSSQGDRFCLGPFHGIRTRKGAELRKREAFSSAAREERSDEAGRGRRQPRADIPHRPPLIWKRSSQGDRFCLGPFHGIRTRKGAELRKREAFSSAAREGRRPEARAGGVSRTRHPSSPTTDLLGLQ